MPPATVLAETVFERLEFVLQGRGELVLVRRVEAVEVESPRAGNPADRGR